MIRYHRFGDGSLCPVTPQQYEVAVMAVADSSGPFREMHAVRLFRYVLPQAPLRLAVAAVKLAMASAGESG